MFTVRFQADPSPRGAPRRYSSILSAVREIVRTEGVYGGLYKGTWTTVIRAAVLTSAQVRRSCCVSVSFYPICVISSLAGLHTFLLLVFTAGELRP